VKAIGPLSFSDMLLTRYDGQNLPPEYSKIRAASSSFSRRVLTLVGAGHNVQIIGARAAHKRERARRGTTHVVVGVSVGGVDTCSRSAALTLRSKDPSWERSVVLSIRRTRPARSWGSMER
jgi:hypothetical protein